MSEELNIEATQAAPEGTTAPETPANENDAVQGEQQTTQQSEEAHEDAKQPESPKRDPWYMRRIDELTKARREAEREREALRALVEQRPAAATAAPATQSTASDPYQLAQQIAQQQALNDAANRTYDAGKSAFGDDFDLAVNTLRQVTDLSQRADFLEAVTALPNAHEVYHYLGKNPDEAAHVLSLSPVKMAIELATVAAKVGRPKAQSKAPAPISAVGRSAAPSSDLSDNLSTAEWIARREAQLEKRRR